MKKKIIALLSLILFQLNFILAGNIKAQIGGYAGSYLRLGADARAQGMGNAFVAVANDITAGFWNPAGLGNLETFQFIFTWTSLSLERQNSYMAIAFPGWRSGSFCISWLSYRINEIEMRDESSHLTGRFSDDKNCLLASYGYHLNKYLSVGVTAKAHIHNIAGYHAAGFGCDLGLNVKPYNFLTVAATIHNLGSSIEWYKTTNHFIRASRFGICARPKPNINLAIDYEYFTLPGKDWLPLTGQYHKWHFGGEYFISNFMILRAGVDHKRFTMGFSVPIMKTRNQLEISYGLSNDPIDDNFCHRFEILFRLDNQFKSTKAEKIPGDRMFAARVLQILPNSLEIDLSEPHGLQQGMIVTIYRKDKSEASSKLVNCSAHVIEIRKSSAVIEVADQDFLSNVNSKDKVVIVFSVERKKK